MTTRRQFVKGSAALTSFAALSLATEPAHAQINLGQARIDVVSDGSLTKPGSFIFGKIPQVELLPIIQKQ